MVSGGWTPLNGRQTHWKNSQSCSRVQGFGLVCARVRFFTALDQRSWALGLEVQSFVLVVLTVQVLDNYFDFLLFPSDYVSPISFFLCVQSVVQINGGLGSIKGSTHRCVLMQLFRYTRKLSKWQAVCSGSICIASRSNNEF